MRLFKAMLILALTACLSALCLDAAGASGSMTSEASDHKNVTGVVRDSEGPLPVYNAEISISRCVESILEQTYRNIGSKGRNLFYACLVVSAIQAFLQRDCVLIKNKATDSAVITR